MSHTFLFAHRFRGIAGVWSGVLLAAFLLPCAAATRTAPRTATPGKTSLWELGKPVRGAASTRHPRHNRAYEIAAWSDLARLRVGTRVQVPLAQGKVASGTVRGVENRAGATSVKGTLGKNGTGFFTISQSESGVRGAVQLPGEKLAFRVVAQSPERALVQEVSPEEMICSDYPAMAGEAPRGLKSDRQAQAIQLLNSRAGAKAQIYLDFDGEVVTERDWNGGKPINAAAYAFSAAEIQQIFDSVKEDFAPFDINVSTDAKRFWSAPANLRVRCIITPTSYFFPTAVGAGGVAIAWGFGSTSPCWVFNRSVKGVAEAISHEVGHTFGLFHDGEWALKPEDAVERFAGRLYIGHSTSHGGSNGGSWAPIMGVGYNAQLTQWSRGEEYGRASNGQDDFAIIASHGFGLVSQEVFTLNYKAPGQVDTRGIIGLEGSNRYQFYTSGGPVSFTAVGANSTNLDINLFLPTIGGRVETSYGVYGNHLGASVSSQPYHDLRAGTYTLTVGNGGNPGWPSFYGSRGAFHLTGSVPGGSTPSSKAVLLAPPTASTMNGSTTLRAKVTGNVPSTGVTFEYRPSLTTATREPKTVVAYGTIKSDSVDVASFAPIDSATLSFNITLPPFVSPFKITLIAPDGTRVPLRDQNSTSSSVIQNTDVSKLLRGKSRGGKWRLELAVGFPGDSVGDLKNTDSMINSWGLSFRTQNWMGSRNANAQPSPGEWTLPWQTSTLLSGKYDVRARPQLSQFAYPQPTFVNWPVNTDVNVIGYTPPTLTLKDISIPEGNSGSTTGTFTLSLSKASPIPVTLRCFSGAVPTTRFPATEGRDYTRLSALNIAFAPGEINKTVNFAVLGDTIDEESEQFALLVDKVTNALAPDTTGVVTILDNDNPPLLSVSIPRAIENAGASLVFKVSLSAASGRVVSLKYQNFNTPQPTAIGGVDYVSRVPAVLTFVPGETYKYIEVRILSDALDEDDEKVGLRLSEVVNLGQTTLNAEGIIVDDDALPSLDNSQVVSVSEGHQGLTEISFNVRLSAPSGRAVTVNYGTALIPDGAADSDDFETVLPRSLQFKPGETTKAVRVKVRGDAVFEADERFGLRLSEAINASIAKNTAECVILNDDVLPAASPLESGSGGKS